MADSESSFNLGIDHLILGCSRLDQGIAWVKERFGIEPMVGGRHPDYGTHNALVSIGPLSYLEIMAPDPAASPPPERNLFNLRQLATPKLVTWVVRREPVTAAAALVAAAGLDLGPVLPGSRQRPDGSFVTWSITDPYADRLDGTVPFLIEWGDSPHPAITAPEIGSLTSFKISTPYPDEVGRVLEALDLSVPIARAPHTRLHARITALSGEDILLD